MGNIADEIRSRTDETLRSKEVREESKQEIQPLSSAKKKVDPEPSLDPASDQAKAFAGMGAETRSSIQAKYVESYVAGDGACIQSKPRKH